MFVDRVRAAVLRKDGMVGLHTLLSTLSLSTTRYVAVARLLACGGDAARTTRDGSRATPSAQPLLQRHYSVRTAWVVEGCVSSQPCVWHVPC